MSLNQKNKNNGFKQDDFGQTVSQNLILFQAQNNNLKRKKQSLYIVAYMIRHRKLNMSKYHQQIELNYYLHPEENGKK